MCVCVGVGVDDGDGALATPSRMWRNRKHNNALLYNVQPPRVACCSRRDASMIYIIFARCCGLRSRAERTRTDRNNNTECLCAGGRARWLQLIRATRHGDTARQRQPAAANVSICIARITRNSIERPNEHRAISIFIL